MSQLPPTTPPAAMPRSCEARDEGDARRIVERGINLPCRGHARLAISDTPADTSAHCIAS